MISKYITSAVLAASVAVIPADEVQADAGDFIAGAIIGGIVGSAAQKNRRTTTRSSAPRKTYRSRLPSTQEGRQIQASLNYFGFDAGKVDGQLGRKSKTAVSQYQAYMGYPVTGALSPFEQNLLISSYNRAQAGGYATSQQIAVNPDGTRGLLKTYRSEMAGQSPSVPQPVPTTTVVVTPQQPIQPTIGTTTTTTVAAASGVMALTDTSASGGSALPNFLGAAGAQPSLASHCNTVSLITNTNGGFVTEASMTDPNVALNEQFCLARTYAISTSEDMIRKVTGFTPAQIAGQCEGFGPAMSEHVASLSLKPQAAVIQDVAGFITSTGMSTAQLSATAKICLGVGYRTDNMDVALGSALLLYTMGEGVYGELMGHHLAQGFGTAKRVDVAMQWYDSGLNAAESGAAAAFVPGAPERSGLIRKASAQLNGAPATAMTTPLQPVSTLPTFNVSE